MTDTAAAADHEPDTPPYNEHPLHPDDVPEGIVVDAIQPVPPIGARPPRVAIDWQASRITAGLVAAIARAQSDIRPVGKDSRNDQGAGGKGYDYASADDMLGELRRAFSRQGVAVVFASYMQDPPEVDLGEKQWLTCTLKIECAAMYTEPSTREVGVLVMRGEQDAIGSAGRPPDKAQRAAETYALGFMARNLGSMNRATTPKDEDRDQDGDQGATSYGRKRGQPRRDEPTPTTQRRVVTTEPTGKGAPASSVAGGAVDKLAGLRDSVIRRFNDLGGAEWKKWGYVCQGAGLDKVVRVGDSDAETLRKLHDYLEGEEQARARAEADDAATAEGGEGA